jgi:peptide deformylase
VTVSGQDVSGKPLHIEASDLLARILQHEVDHLDGVLILDRTDRQSRKAAMREWREHLLAQQG